MKIVYDKILGKMREVTPVESGASEEMVVNLQNAIIVLQNYFNKLHLYVGVEWDPDDPNPDMTRVGLTDWQAVPFFDNSLEVVQLHDDLTEGAILANYRNPVISGVTDGSQGQIMAKFRSLFYRELIDDNGKLFGLHASPHPLPGFSAHPKFTWGNSREEIYLGVYEASEVAGKLASVSGQPVRTSLSMQAFHNLAIARGEGFGILDEWSQHLLDLMTYIRYATFNIQSVVPGYTNRSAWDYAFTRPTGRSNILTSMDGSVDYDPTGLDVDLGEAGWSSAERKIANRISFLENYYGSVWKFLGQCAADGRAAGDNAMWHTPDPRLFSTSEAFILANWQKGPILPATSNEAYLKNLGQHMLPREMGGDGSTYVTDYFWSYLDDAARNYFRSVLAGSRLTFGVLAGVAARYSSYALSSSSSHYGARLRAEKN